VIVEPTVGGRYRSASVSPLPTANYMPLGSSPTSARVDRDARRKRERCVVARRKGRAIAVRSPKGRPLFAPICPLSTAQRQQNQTDEIGQLNKIDAIASKADNAFSK